jgi:hypothetical protein
VSEADANQPFVPVVEYVDSYGDLCHRLTHVQVHQARCGAKGLSVANVAQGRYVSPA